MNDNIAKILQNLYLYLQHKPQMVAMAIKFFQRPSFIESGLV